MRYVSNISVHELRRGRARADGGIPDSYLKVRPWWSMNRSEKKRNADMHGRRGAATAHAATPLTPPPIATRPRPPPHSAPSRMPPAEMTVSAAGDLKRPLLVFADHFENRKDCAVSRRVFLLMMATRGKHRQPTFSNSSTALVSHVALHLTHSRHDTATIDRVPSRQPRRNRCAQPSSRSSSSSCSSSPFSP